MVILSSFHVYCGFMWLGRIAELAVCVCYCFEIPMD